MKSAGIHLLSQYSFIHTQPLSFLTNSTGPILLFVVLALWIPITQGCFVPSLVEIGPVVLEKKMKMWKVYRQTETQTDDRQTDDRQQVIRKAHLSFQLGELKTEGFIDVNITFLVCLGFFSHKRITWGSVKRCKFWPILKGLKALRVTWVSLWEFEVLSLTRL